MKPTLLLLPLLALLACAAPIPCELCAKPIPPGREIVLTRAGADHNFRCIHCAMTAAAGAEGDVAIRALSTVSGKPVTLRRAGAAWSVEPATAVFMILPEEGGECLDRHQAFVDEAELRKAPGGGAVEAFTIDRMREMLAAGRPK